MHNKAYQINYITNYIYFIKGPSFIDLNTIDYESINSLKPINFLFDYIDK